MKPCLIFDLDGTLVDSLPGIAASLNRCLELHGLPGHSNAAVRRFIGNGLRTLVQRAAPSGSDSAMIDSLVSLFKKDYDQSWKSGTTPYPGILNLLTDLQRAGYSMAVLSNKTHDFTVDMVAGLFPNIHFHKVLGQRDGVPQKPHPAGAFQIAQAVGHAPETCILIGDSTVDMETARNADMQAIAVLWGYHDRDKLIAAGAEIVIDHPSDLEAKLAPFEF